MPANFKGTFDAMTTFKMLLAEIGYRKINFAMSLLAVLIAVALFVAGPMLADGYSRETQTQIEGWTSSLNELERGVAQLKANMGDFEAKTADQLGRLEKETTRLMRDMGFNLMIVPAQTNMSDFWAADFASATMPEEYADRLAADRRLNLVTPSGGHASGEGRVGESQGAVGRLFARGHPVAHAPQIADGL